MLHRQDRLFRENDFAFKALHGTKTPVFVKKHISYGSKHPIKDKLKEPHLLADIKNLVSKILENGVRADQLCEGEASAKLYAKSLKV